MFNRQIEAVLNLISLSIFADKRVLSEEISAFVESADLIQSKLQSDIVISETKLLMWFELNRSELKSIMGLGPAGFKHWFENLISELPVISDKRFIMDIVERISNADGEFHISEKALEVMLERVFERPSFAA